jgi:hypothetical protein
LAAARTAAAVELHRPGNEFLEHATEAIKAVMGGGSLLFVPFASSYPDTYTGVMRQTLAPRVLRSPASTRPGT